MTKRKLGIAIVGLGGAVGTTGGGGACADVVRRILLDLIKKSGRFYVDIEQIIAD